MEPSNRSPHFPPPLEPVPVTDRADSWPGPDELWDQHGPALLTMAWTVLGDESEALLAVTLGLMDVYRVPTPDPTLRTAARCVYRHCHRPATDDPGQPEPTRISAMAGLREVGWSQRSALALCFFGGLSYREAAAELGVPADVVAWLLLSGLQEMGRLGLAYAAGEPPD